MRYEEIHKKMVKVDCTCLEKNNIIINSVIKEDPIGKKPLSRPRLRWEDCVKSDVKRVDPRGIH